MDEVNQPDNEREPESFGSVMREMRYQKGMGIKKLAPELGVDYTYISRIENNQALPSENVIEKLAEYFGQDKDELMILADRIPCDVMEILRRNPKKALQLIRENFKENVK